MKKDTSIESPSTTNTTRIRPDLYLCVITKQKIVIIAYVLNNQNS